MFKKLIYKISWEGWDYIWQTNNLRRRLDEHQRSWLLENLTNSNDSYLRLAIQKRLSISAEPTDNPNEDEREAIQKSSSWNLLNILMKK